MHSDGYAVVKTQTPRSIYQMLPEYYFWPHWFPSMLTRVQFLQKEQTISQTNVLLCLEASLVAFPFQEYALAETPLWREVNTIQWSTCHPLSQEPLPFMNIHKAFLCNLCLNFKRNSKTEGYLTERTMSQCKHKNSAVERRHWLLNNGALPTFRHHLTFPEQSEWFLQLGNYDWACDQRRTGKNQLGLRKIP